MNTIAKYGLLVLATAWPVGARADQDATTQHKECTWTGTLRTVSMQENAVTGRGFLILPGKSFPLAKGCTISTLDNNSATLGELQPGEKVTIEYQNVEGVLVAERIMEKALRYAGAVKAVNQKEGIVTMEQAAISKPFRGAPMFRISANCKVVLWNNSGGTLADVQPGDRLTVIYELPNRLPVAYRLRDWSSTLVGTIDAIDPAARCVKAREKSEELKFELANDCRIILPSGKTGHLKDLMPGQEFRFTYEEVNGVMVLERIAPVGQTKPAETASAG